MANYTLSNERIQLVECLMKKIKHLAHVHHFLRSNFLKTQIAT